jgi:DNA-binding phage protein
MRSFFRLQKMHAAYGIMDRKRNSSQIAEDAGMWKTDYCLVF